MEQEWLDPDAIDDADPEQRVLYYRHLKAYDLVRERARDRRVLEIGCGAGYGAAQLAEVAEQIVGVDIDPDSLRRARDEGGVDVARSDPSRGIPFPAASFDLLVSFQVLEHIPPDHVDAFLDEIRRVLVPDGLFVVTTPNRRLRLLPLQRPWNPYHAKEYTARELERVLGENFREVRVTGLRARPEVEAVERDRVRQDPVTVYLIRPLEHLFSTILPRALRRRLRPLRDRIKGRSEPDRLRRDNRGDTGSRNRASDPPDEPLDVQLADFYLSDERYDEAIDLVAFCRP